MLIEQLYRAWTYFLITDFKINIIIFKRQDTKTIFVIIGAVSRRLKCYLGLVQNRQVSGAESARARDLRSLILNVSRSSVRTINGKTLKVWKQAMLAWLWNYEQTTIEERRTMKWLVDGWQARSMNDMASAVQRLEVQLAHRLRK